MTQIVSIFTYMYLIEIEGVKFFYNFFIFVVFLKQAIRNNVNNLIKIKYNL